MQWINHEWLAELVFFGVYRIFGDRGLLVGKLIIGLFLIINVTAICKNRRQNPVLFVAVMIPVIVSLSPGFMLRPQLASYLLFSIFLYLIHLYFYQKINRLYFLPLLMMVWVNLHGGFLMGVVLLGIIVGWQTIFKLFNKKKCALNNPLDRICWYASGHPYQSLRVPSALFSISLFENRSTHWGMGPGIFT
jgi:hypothetical protein